MIASSYEANDSFISCDNNNIYKESVLSDQIIWPNYSPAYLIKKSSSFKETIGSQSEDILSELNDNVTDTPSLQDNNKDSSLFNQLCTSFSCPGNLCLDCRSSQSRECGLSNSSDYRLYHKPRGVWPFCPVDVCTRCKDAALTLNNRGACLCDSVTSCHHRDLFGTSSWWPCNDEHRQPSMILQEGYRLLENQDKHVKKKTKSQKREESVTNRCDEVGITGDIDRGEDDSSSSNSSSPSSCSLTSSSSSSSPFSMFSSSSSFSTSSSSSSLTSSSSSPTSSTTKSLPSLSERYKVERN